MSTLGCTSDGTANQVVNEKFVMSPSHSLRALVYSTSFYSEVTAVVEEIVDDLKALLLLILLLVLGGLHTACDPQT